MGVRNGKREIFKRLESKTLDAKFLTEIRHGLNCSPFEAEAVLEVVKEVYFPFVDQHGVKAPPGKITLVAVRAHEPAGKPVAECEKQSVCLTIHRGRQDDRILQEQGAAGFRQTRIPEICQEALSQGALLTREHPAFGVLDVPLPCALAVLLRGDIDRHVREVNISPCGIHEFASPHTGTQAHANQQLPFDGRAFLFVLPGGPAQVVTFVFCEHADFPLRGPGRCEPAKGMPIELCTIFGQLEYPFQLLDLLRSSACR